MNVLDALYHHDMTYADYGRALQDLPEPRTVQGQNYRMLLVPQTPADAPPLPAVQPHVLYFNKVAYAMEETVRWMWDINPEHVEVTT